MKKRTQQQQGKTTRSPQPPQPKPVLPQLVLRLATEFSLVLREWLDEDGDGTGKDWCGLIAQARLGEDASHEYCDPNQAMLDAWERVLGIGTVPATIRGDATEDQQAHDNSLWNQAWELAFGSHFFYTARIQAPTRDEFCEAVHDVNTALHMAKDAKDDDTVGQEWRAQMAFDRVMHMIRRARNTKS